MRLSLSRPTLPTLKRIAERALLVTIIYAFCGFLLLPLLARSILKEQLQRALHRPVSLAKVAINPFTLSLRIKKLTIADLLPGRPLFSCDELFADLELLSLVKLGPVLKEVTLSGPALSVIRIKGRDFNFSDLIPQGSEAEVPEKAAALPRFSIGALAIHQGRILFSDLTVNQAQRVEAIELQVPSLSSMAADQEGVVRPQVNARVNGAPLTLMGELTPFAPKVTSSLQLTIGNAELASLAPYLPKEWGVALVSGWAAMELNLSLSGPPGLAYEMRLSGRLALTALDLTEVGGAPLLTLPSLTVTMAPSAILKRELHLTGVALEQPVVTLQRNADRSTNLVFLAPLPGANATPAPAETTATPLQLSVDTVAIAGARIALTDLAVAPPFHTVLAPVDLTLSGLSTQGEGGAADYTLTLASEAGETLSMEGSATLTPWRSEGELTLTGLSLPKYRPYWADLLNCTLASAAMDLDTAFELDPSGPTPGLTLSDLGLTLRDLSLRRGEEDPFVAIPALTLEQGRLDLAGRLISLGKISSQGGFVAGQRLADGSIDLGSLFRQASAGQTREAATPPWAIEVKSFAFSDYGVHLRDAAHPEPLALGIGQLAIHGQGLQTKEAGVIVQGLGGELADLSLGRAQGGPVLSIPSLSVAGVAVDQPGRAVTIERISSHGGRLACVRQKEGTLDLAALLAPRVAVNPEKRPAAPSPAWDLTLGQLGLSDFRVSFADQTLAHPSDLELDAITLTARELSTRGSCQATVEGEFGLADQGHLAFSGRLGHDPLAVELGIKATGIPVATVVPYWGERLKMRVRTGEFAADGRLSIQAHQKKPLAIRYQGEASLVDFLGLDGAGQKLLAWKSLTTDGLDLAVTPLRLAINNVGLTDYFLSLVLSPEGALNLRELVVAEGNEGEPPRAEEPSTATAPGDEPRIAIGRVTLQGGEIDFSDRHIRPNFTTKLLAMTGRISGLASAQESRAEVDLFGKLANRAPITITGSMNPLAPELFVDLKGSMKDVELSSLTPYAGRYVGYTIRKGKLFLDTSYSIVGTKIDSHHSFLLDQFLLGDQVESREAIKAPIKLAVALLKDRKGEIHFELPIKGDLSRPDFRIGDIAAKIFMGLLTKAVTAPFALLGALFGGEELRMVEFALGSVAILPESQKRLDALAKALHDRPGLTLEIKGYAAQDHDHEALVRQRYAQLLLAGEEGGQVTMEEGARLVAAMTPKEMEKRLTRAYRQADFPKPRNILGFTKGLEPEEMKKLLLSHIEVSGDDLLLLADERAQVVTAYLQGTRGVEPKRLSRLEPGVEPARGEGKVSGSRVDFSLSM